MITLKKIVSLALDIKDINDAVILFLKEKGFETSDIVTEDNLLELIRGGALVLNAKELNIDNVSEKCEVKENKDKRTLYFPASLISRLGKSTQGLEMFLGNVEDEQVLLILTNSFYSLGSLDIQLLKFMFNLTSPNPSLKKVKSKEEIEEYFQTRTKLVVKNVIANFGRQAMREFESILSRENKVLAKLKPNINLAKEDLWKVKLEDLTFSHRVHQAFKKYEYHNNEFSLKTVGDLIILNFDDFKKFRPVGEKTVQEIVNFIILYEL